MKKGTYLSLSRRERQVMDILYREERASAAPRIREAMADAPSHSAVRARSCACWRTRAASGTSPRACSTSTARWSRATRRRTRR